MCKWYKEMNCYLLAPAQMTSSSIKDKVAERAQLENAFRNYAAVFDKVKIVINQSQEKEHYLNFPYVCHTNSADNTPKLHSLLNDAKSDAIFIGHADMGEFPIKILANLLKSYDGELFLGYKSDNQQSHQLQFGIYHKSLVSKTADQSEIRLDSLSENSYRLLHLPESSELFI